MPINLADAVRFAELAERAQIAAGLLVASLGMRDGAIGATVELPGLEVGRRIRVDDAVAREILERHALAEIERAEAAGLDVAELKAAVLAAAAPG